MHDGEPAFLSAHKKEVILAALLARANRVVPIDELIPEIWGDRSPLRATTTVHVRICELRKFLRSCGMPESPVITRSPGYFIRVEPGELDAQVFADLAARGQEASQAGRHHEAVEALRGALDLAGEDSLVGLRGGPIVNGFANWLDELRLSCTESLLESEIALGRHRDTVSRLQTLFAQHPLHEAFHRQLIMALHRCDRRADALRVYQLARNILQKELGLEPCLATRRVHHAVLTADEDFHAKAAA
ncbi:BTAD domain-containing putative transcriptional regulator [Streptomyces sp. Ac-502]|uniref:AfsR/SARP family transcriptional regulator n=1 Tax=Streptomyces sp. Ac-502 TaxID=3342801 RepID=UPI003862942A